MSTRAFMSEQPARKQAIADMYTDNMPTWHSGAEMAERERDRGRSGLGAGGRVPEHGAGSDAAAGSGVHEGGAVVRKKDMLMIAKAIHTARMQIESPPSHVQFNVSDGLLGICHVTAEIAIALVREHGASERTIISFVAACETGVWE